MRLLWGQLARRRSGFARRIRVSVTTCREYVYNWRTGSFIRILRLLVLSLAMLAEEFVVSILLLNLPLRFVVTYKS